MGNRPIVDYELSIHTSDILCAGTDNDVYITVSGMYNNQEVSTEKINLSARVNGNAFERDDTHKITFQWEDIGRPHKIRLELSNSLLDDWQFDKCTIQRKKSNFDPDGLAVNKLVTFKGNNKVFHRKDVYTFEGDLAPLVENAETSSVYAEFGGVEIRTFEPEVEYTFETTLSKGEETTIVNSTVIENGETYKLDAGGEFGYKAANTGGAEGKVHLSYGFSKTKLETVTKEKSQTASQFYSNSTKIVIKPTVRSTYAVVYSNAIVEVVRTCKGAGDVVRKDIVNLGRRICAVVKLENENGNYVYVTPEKTYPVDKIWLALNNNQEKVEIGK